MPSGKRAKQQRRAAAASGGKKPPSVRSKGAAGGPGSGFSFSKRTLVIAGVVVVVLIGLGVGLPIAFGGGSSSGTTTGGASSGRTAPLATLGTLVQPPAPGPLGPEGIPLEGGASIAPAGAPQPGASVDGIKCETGGEETLFHIHTRLTVFVDGKQRSIPYGVGIAGPITQPTQRGPFVGNGACFSWLHTHAQDGIVHIESPVKRTFTLGNFFDVWGQPLSSTQVGTAKGKVTALLNGSVWTGNPRAIPLDAHNQIQLEVGKPLVGPEKITDWAGL